MGVPSTSPRMSVVTFNSTLLSCWNPHPLSRNISEDGFCATHILLTPAPHRDSLHLILTWWDGRGEEEEEVAVGWWAMACREAGTINHVSLTGEMGERRHRSPAACHRSIHNERIRAGGGRSQPLNWPSRPPTVCWYHAPSAIKHNLLRTGSSVLVLI